MTRYREYRPGKEAIGTVVVRMFESGGELRATVRRISEPEHDTYPSEEMSPELAFRLAENKRKGEPGSEIVVEAEPGTRWNQEDS